MNIPHDAIGKAIKVSRIEHRYTQDELAEKVNITIQHLQKIENGSRKPSVELLYNLTQILNFSVDDIFFPQAIPDDQLNKKINRRISQCNEYELRLALSIIESMLELRSVK